MTLEEKKAKELIDKFKKHSHGFNIIGTYDEGQYHTKKIALIAVEEILNNEVWEYPHNTNQGKLFYEQVKSAIINSK